MMAWFQQYEKWARHNLEGQDFWACPCYIWTDETQHYYRHWVYYYPGIIAGLNTQDYFYFKDADANAYWCRYCRTSSKQLCWSYLSPVDYRDRLAMLRDDMFSALEQARSLSIAGANVPPGQLVKLSYLHAPPPDLFEFFPMQ